MSGWGVGTAGVKGGGHRDLVASDLPQGGGGGTGERGAGTSAGRGWEETITGETTTRVLHDTSQIVDGDSLNRTSQRKRNNPVGRCFLRGKTSPYLSIIFLVCSFLFASAQSRRVSLILNCAVCIH